MTQTRIRQLAALPNASAFLTATQTALPGDAAAFAVGDFDGNGTKDAAVVLIDNTGQTTLAILLGNGDGTFQAPLLTSINFITSSDALYAAELSGDSRDDLLIVHGGGTSSSIDVLLSSGSGSFAPPCQYSDTIHVLTGITVADVNHDGHPDIVLLDGVGNTYAGDFPKVATFLNNGNGTFQPQSVVALPSTVSYSIFADVNGDGYLDIVTNTKVFLGTANGYQPGVSLPGATQDSPHSGSVSVADLNSDGKLDIIVASNSTNQVTVYLNSLSGFQAGTSYWAGFDPEYVIPGDVNGDGYLDIVVGNASSAGVSVLTGGPNGSFSPITMGFSVGGYLWTTPALADFDGDGKLDVLALQFTPNSNSALTLAKGYGDGTFLAADNFYALPTSDAEPAWGMGIASADFNGDGLPDFVLGNAAGPNAGVTVFLANADGTMNSGVNYGSGGYLEFVATADFNGDGRQDVVASEMSTGDVLLFLGNGDGTLQAPQRITVSGGQGQGAGIVVGDFNHDGSPDIAVAAAPSTLYVLLNNGSGGFSVSSTYALSNYGWKLAAADLNGDGVLDLVVALGSNYVAILKGKADGTFTALPDLDIAASYPDTISVGDINHDNAPDLVISLEDNNGYMGIVVLLGNGDGTFLAPVLYASSTRASAGSDSYPGEVMLADVNHDGNLDAVYTNSGYGTVGVMYGNGDGTFQSPIESPVGGWPYSVWAVDMNADGALDAVIGNDNYSGVTVLLNPEGTKVDVTSSLNPAITTDTVTFTAAVSAIRGVTTTPAGTVTFKDASTVLGTATLTGGSASFTTSSLSSGTRVISAIYSGDPSFLPGSGSMLEVVNQPPQTGSYTLAASPGTAIIHPGQSATFTITATPINGFTGSISFDCGSLPTGLTCQFTPAAITISGQQPGSAQLVVSASPTILSAAVPNGRYPLTTLSLWASFAGMLFGSVVFENTDQRKRRVALLLLLVVLTFAATVFLTGCGTTVTAKAPAPASKTVQVVAKAANGPSTQSLNIVVVVEP